MKSLLLFFVLATSVALAQDFEGRKKINGTSLFLSIKGKGETIVVIHGGPGLNHSYFRPHLNALEKKFRVVYYDQRACGQSATPSPDSITIRFLVEDLEGIRKELKVEKLNLLAHSWGAVLGTHYAIAYPGRVSKIIYSNPAMLSKEYDREAQQLSIKKTTKEDSLLRTQLMAGGITSVDKYTQIIQLSFRTSAFDPSKMNQLNLNLPAHFMEANSALFTGMMKDPQNNDNLYDSLKKFTFPTLIIHGEADVLPIASIHQLKSNLPKSELVVMKRSGHFPFVEEQEKYVDVITNFIQSKK
jgi:proline iminopeptidase